MEEQKKASAERILKDFGQKIDELIDKVKTKSEDWDTEDLKKGWTKVEKEINDFTEENKGKFSEVGIQIEKAGQELKKALELLFSKKEETNS